MAGIGERIKKERKRLGWLQEDLASAAGVSVRTISSVENIEGESPGKHALAVAKVQEALQVPVQIKSMADEVARLSGDPEHAIDIAINCRSIVKNLDNLKEPDLALVRASLEWVLDKIRGYETEKGTPVPDEDID